MARPLPTPGPNDVWGADLNASITERFGEVGTELTGRLSEASLSTTIAAEAQSAVDAAVGTTPVPTSATMGGMLTDIIRRGKGGVVGTDGKGVVSFRFDHNLDPFLSTVWPLFTARALPGSFHALTDSIGNPTAPVEPTTKTWTDLITAYRQGCEVWAHSATHSDPATAGTTWEHEIVNPKTVIESKGIRCMGWSPPGAPATYGTFSSPSAFESLPGRLILGTYGLFNGALPGTALRTLPSGGEYGSDHITIDSMTSAQVIDVIDRVARHGWGVQFMLHPSVVGQTGRISVADLTTVLDHLVTLRDAGKVEVLTNTGLSFADPHTDSRLDLIPGGDFEAWAPGSPPPAGWEEKGGSWSVQTDGGHTGTKYLRFPNPATRMAYVLNPRDVGVDGHVFMFEGWARASTASATSANVRIGTGTGIMANPVFPLTQAAGWTRIRVPFAVTNLGTGTLSLEFGRNTGSSTVDWDDVHVYAT